MRTTLFCTILLSLSACASTEPVITTRPGAVPSAGSSAGLAIGAPPIVATTEGRLEEQVIDAMSVPVEDLEVRVEDHTAFLAGRVMTVEAWQQVRADALDVEGIHDVDAGALYVR